MVTIYQWMREGSVSIQTRDDTLAEPTENFCLDLVAVSGKAELVNDSCIGIAGMSIKYLCLHSNVFVVMVILIALIYFSQFSRVTLVMVSSVYPHPLCCPQLTERVV